MENIYKIGMSEQENLTRFKQYPKGSKLLLQIILRELKNLYIKHQKLKLFQPDYLF